VNKKLILKYSLFALVSIVINLLFQEITYKVLNLFLESIKKTGSLLVFPDLNFYISIFSGTFFGLLTKYILDKKYIFYYKIKSKKEDLFKFILYTSMGIVTTIIFWGFEIIFKNVFDFYTAKYIGGLIGLIIGYTTKYFLDKKFVFKNN
jgi:putative flippase GtrA